MLTIEKVETILKELRGITDLESFRDIDGERFCKKNKISFGQLNFLVSVVCSERHKKQFNMKTKKEIVKEIREDIDKGIYQQFPKLKARLTYISNKMFDGIYIINGEYKLSLNEVRDLAEAGYLNSYDVDEFFEKQYNEKDTTR